jgi:isocitrate/isopropylmalate dehydrogenase
LDYLGEKKASELIDNAVSKALSSGKIKDLSAGNMGMTTSEVGDFVVSLI